MGWSEWPSWVKGGVIGIFLYFFAIISKTTYLLGKDDAKIIDYALSFLSIGTFFISGMLIGLIFQIFFKDFKEGSEWRKFGMIFGLISVFAYILIGGYILLYQNPFAFIYFIFTPGRFIFGIDGFIEFFPSFIFSISSYFLIGAIVVALIGFIVGKIKSRNENRT